MVQVTARLPDALSAELDAALKDPADPVLDWDELRVAAGCSLHSPRLRVGHHLPEPGVSTGAMGSPSQGEAFLA